MAKQKLNLILSGAFLSILAALFLLAAPLGLTILTFILVQLKAGSSKPWLWISGILSLGALLAWWALWVKFRTLPAVEYWICILVSLLLLSAGIIARKTRTAT